MTELLIKIGSFCEKHKTKIIFSFIFLFGLSLRVYKLFSNQDFWFDEVVVADLARRTPGEMTELLKLENNPPLYFILIKLWRELFGEKEWMLRSLSTIISLLTFFPVYLLAKNLFDKKIALISTLIFAVSPLIVYQSAEARMYSLLLLFSTLTFLFYHQALKTGRNHYWLLTALCLVIANYTHLTSLLIYPTLLLHLFISKANKAVWIKSWATAISTLAVYSFWFIPFITRKISDYQNNLFENDWYTSVPIDGPSYVLAYASLLFKSGFGMLDEVSIIKITSSLILIIPSVYIVYKLNEIQSKDSVWFLSILIFVPLLILSFFNVSATRYFTLTLTPLLIFLSLGFYLLFVSIRSYAKAITLYSIVLTFSLLGTLYSETIDSTYRNLGKILVENNVQQLLATPISAESKYYNRDLRLKNIYIPDWGHKNSGNDYLAYVLQNNWNWNRFTTWSRSDQIAIEEAINKVITDLDSSFAFISGKSVTDQKILSKLDEHLCSKKFFNTYGENILSIYYKNINLSQCNFSDEILSYPQ